MVDLQKQPLANSLLKNKRDFKKEIEVPLKLAICKVQTHTIVSLRILNFILQYLWVKGTQKIKSYKHFFQKLKKIH